MAISKTFARRCRTLQSRGGVPAPVRLLGTRSHFPFAIAAAALFLLGAVGCHKSTGKPITIIIDPSATQTLDAGQVVNFQAIVAGDIAGKGVSWTLTLGNNACTGTAGAGCGALTNVTSSSVTYTAPTLSSAQTITLKATSIAEDTIETTVTLNIVIPPTITTTSIPSSAMNGVPYSATVLATNGVTPLTFFVSSGSLPAGLNLSTSGTIQGTPTFTGPGGSSTSSFVVQVKDFNGVASAAPVSLAITVAAPPPIQASASLPPGFTGAPYSALLSVSGGVPPISFSLTGVGTLPLGLNLSRTSGQITGLPTATGTNLFSVLITDSAVPTHQTQTVPASITINNPPALSITTSSLPNGTAAAGYSGLLQATGGTPPYTWSVTNGQLPAGLALATQPDNTAAISGIPVLAGTSSFTVQVKDSNLSPQAPTASYTVAIASSANSNSLLRGSYAYLFQGFDSDGPVSLAGTLSTDGNGNITSGIQDSNRVSGIVQAATLTGTYSLGISGADARGTLHLIATPALQAPLIVDYQLVLDGTGVVRLIENNNTSSNNDVKSTHGSGVLKPISQASFSASSLSGNYAFEFSGQDFAGQREALGGILHADGQSLFSPVAGDINDGGTFAQLQSSSGSFAAGALRGSATLLYELAGKTQTQLQFAFYFVSPSDLFFVETDPPTSTNQLPRLSGEALLQQTGSSFGPSSFSGKSVVTGTGLSGSNAAVLAGLFTAPLCDGNTADAALAYDQNSGGTISTGVAPAATACSVASNGRATFSTLDPHLGAAYLTGPGQGFLLGRDAAVTVGLFELQSPSTFNTGIVNGSYALSAASPGDKSSPSFLGQVTSIGNGAVPGTLDEVDSPGTPAHIGGGLSVTINTMAASGRGTATSNGTAGFPTNLAIYAVSPAQSRVISLDPNPGNAHPLVISLNH